jgi:septal ring factor EnvC (AmiA/AmiB activator)
MRAIFPSLAAGFAAILLWGSVPELAQAQAPQRESIKERRARLKALRDDLKVRRDAIRALDAEGKSILDSMGSLDESLARLEEEVEHTKARSESLKAQLSDLERQLANEKAAFESLQKRVAGRMRALYVLKSGGAVRALLDVQNFEDLALRRKLLTRLARNDLILVKAYDKSRHSIAKKQSRLKSALSEIRDSERELTDQVDLIKATREERKQALLRIEKEKALAKRAAEELTESQRSLSRLVAGYVKKSRPRPKARAISQGTFPWPVRGTLIRRFGSIKDRVTKAVLVSNGIHIRAPLGTPVYSVAQGSVVHVAWIRGFGRMIIVDHGDGQHALYAHLSAAQVQRGQAVAAGQVLGRVGDTESPNGPKLYFELRNRGRPMDPLPWLRPQGP